MKQGLAKQGLTLSRNRIVHPPPCLQDVCKRETGQPFAAVMLHQQNEEPKLHAIKIGHSNGLQKLPLESHIGA